MLRLFQLIKHQKKSAAPSMAAITTQTTGTKKFAVVTGGNKGIGFEICRQLASKGISVVLTARNEERGLEAVEKLKSLSGLSDLVTFHQLDVVNSGSVSSLAEFVGSEIGKLDILVNNAGIGEQGPKKGYELAVDVLQTNYYGAKQTTETLLPLLQLSDSPRIVNVSSSMGILKSINNKRAKEILSDADNLTEERIDQVLNEFLEDVKEGNVSAKGWPGYWSAYCVSKAAMNTHTRILAKKYPTMKINCVCPGWVKTDLGNGILSTEEGAKGPVRLALLPDDGPTGVFFNRMEASPF